MGDEFDKKQINPENEVNDQIQESNQTANNDASRNEKVTQNVDENKEDLNNNISQNQDSQSIETQPAIKQDFENQEIDYNDLQIQNQQKLLALRQTGNIFNILGLVCLALCFIIVIGGILSLLFKIAFIFVVGAILVVICLITLFTILMSEQYRGWWSFLGKVASGEILNNVINFLLKLVPYISVVGFVASALSILFISFSKNHKSRAKIIVSSICMVMLLIIFIFSLGAKTNSWKY